MILVHFDKMGMPSFYDTLLNYSGGIPTPNIQITAEQHADFFARGQRHRVIDGKWTYIEPPATTLEEEKAVAWERIKAERNKLEQVGFPYKGKILDSDPASVQRISIAAQAAMTAKAAGQAYSLSWTCADNTVLTLDADGAIGMPLALAQFSDRLHQAARAAREAIDEAKDVAGVNAAEAAVKWPE